MTRRKRYSAEFKREALRRANEEGVTDTLVAEELGIGLAVGLVLAGVGYLLLRRCHELGWVTEVWVQITSVALAISCFAVAQSLHGSGYIAAFSGGILFPTTGKKEKK